MESLLNFVDPLISFSHSTAFLWIYTAVFVAYVLINRVVHSKALKELESLRIENKALSERLRGIPEISDGDSVGKSAN